MLAPALPAPGVGPRGRRPRGAARRHASLRDLLAAGDPLAAALHALQGGELDDATHLAQLAIAEASRPVDEARATLVLADVMEATDPAAAWRLRAQAAGELRELGAHHDVLAALRGRPAPELDPEVAATVLLHLGASEWDLGDHVSARDHMEKALSLVHGTGSEAELLIRAGLAMYQTRVNLDGRAAIDDARAALALAIERGQHVAFCRTASRPRWSPAAIQPGAPRSTPPSMARWRRATRRGSASLVKPATSTPSSPATSTPRRTTCSGPPSAIAAATASPCLGSGPTSSCSTSSASPTAASC